MVETYFPNSLKSIEAVQFRAGYSVHNEIENWSGGQIVRTDRLILRLKNQKNIDLELEDWVVKDENIFYTLPNVIFQKRFAKQIDMFKLPDKYSKPIDMEAYSAVSPDRPFPAAVVTKILDGLKGGRGVSWDYSADGEEIIFKDDMEDDLNTDYPPYLDCPKPIPPRRVK